MPQAELRSSSSLLLKLALVTRRILILAAIMERRFVGARLRGLVETLTDVVNPAQTERSSVTSDAVLGCCRNFPLHITIEFHKRIAEEFIE
jgi:hypothetical protein